jgi:hypothetical protein
MRKTTKNKTTTTQKTQVKRKVAQFITPDIEVAKTTPTVIQKIKTTVKKMFDVKWLSKAAKKGFRTLDNVNRAIKPAHVTRMAESIMKLGILRPVVVAYLDFKGVKDYYIIDGQHLYHALIRLGYDIPYVIIDVTGGWGISVIRYLVNKKYKKIHYDRPRQNDVKIQLKNLQRGELQPGFTMKSGAIRDYVIREFERRLREGEALIYSLRLLSEIKTFVFNDNTNRYDHMRSAHDDLLIATGMLFAVYMFSKTIGNEFNIYLNYAKSAIVRKGDEFTDMNTEFQKKMLSQDGQDTNYERKNDMIKGKDWYANGNSIEVPERQTPKINNNPYIFVR